MKKVCTDMQPALRNVHLTFAYSINYEFSHLQQQSLGQDY